MKSRSVLSAGALMGLAVGLAVGAAAGLLATPMRGAAMRASLRSRADDAFDRGMMLIEEGRRVFSTTPATVSPFENEPSVLRAPLGEIAEMHAGSALSSLEVRS